MQQLQQYQTQKIQQISVWSVYLEALEEIVVRLLEERWKKVREPANMSPQIDTDFNYFLVFCLPWIELDVWLGLNHGRVYNPLLNKGNPVY